MPQFGQLNSINPGLPGFELTDFKKANDQQVMARESSSKSIEEKIDAIIEINRTLVALLKEKLL